MFSCVEADIFFSFSLSASIAFHKNCHFMYEKATCREKNERFPELRKQCYGYSRKKLYFNLRFIPLIRFPPFFQFLARRTPASSNQKPDNYFSWKLFLMVWRLKVIISMLFFCSFLVYFFELFALMLFSWEFFLFSTQAREDVTKMFFFWKKWLLTRKLYFNTNLIFSSGIKSLSSHTKGAENPIAFFAIIMSHSAI